MVFNKILLKIRIHQIIISMIINNKINAVNDIDNLAWQP